MSLMMPWEKSSDIPGTAKVALLVCVIVAVCGLAFGLCSEAPAHAGTPIADRSAQRLVERQTVALERIADAVEQLAACQASSRYGNK